MAPPLPKENFTLDAGRKYVEELKSYGLQRFEQHFKLSEHLKNQPVRKFGFSYHFWHTVIAISPAVLIYFATEHYGEKLDSKWMEQSPHPVPDGMVVKEWPPKKSEYRLKVMSRRQRHEIESDFLEPPPKEFYEMANLKAEVERIEAASRATQPPKDNNQSAAAATSQKLPYNQLQNGGKHQVALRIMDMVSSTEDHLNSEESGQEVSTSGDESSRKFRNGRVFSRYAERKMNALLASHRAGPATEQS